ncbi:ABC transporter permease [Vibrio qinghaiensis]|uniref:histidine kinase n=1 Tax=Vibrio qinghaiensis TaxID=2025808 RepID=A0A223MXZ3_9VIBR|nr:transporter substrate-binding domain-containing protein [Vibrio qinghaiensis]ASU22436.1 ABC transporter permease [Vibrio qinghaiensis]
MIGKIKLISFFIIISFNINAKNLTYELYPSEIITRNTVCKESSVPINIGLLHHLDEPFGIKFGNYISGMEPDHINLLIPCSEGKIKYVFYESIDEIEKDLKDGSLQFIVSNDDPILNGMTYEKLKFRSDQYVALTTKELTKLNDEIVVGYVKDCFIDELKNAGYNNIKCLKFTHNRDAYISMINHDVDITIIEKTSATYIKNRIKSKNLKFLLYFDRTFNRYLIYKNSDQEKTLDLKKLKYKYQLVKSIWSIDTSNDQLTTLTEDEKRWIKDEEPIIKVAFNNSFPPYTFYDSNGDEAGVIPELLTSIGIKTGLRFQWIQMNNLPDITKSLEEGIIDIVALASYNDNFKERASYSIPFSFTDISSVKRIKDDKESIIAISSSYSLQDHIRHKFPDSKIIIAKNTLSAIEMVAKGTADVAYGYSEVMSFLVKVYFKDHLTHQIVQLSYPGDLRFAISRKNKNERILKIILDKSIENLGFSYVDRLTGKWNADIINANEVWVEKNRMISNYYYIILILISSILIYIIFYFINEKKKQKILLEWEFKASIIDGIPIPIIVRNHESRLIHFNKAFSDFSLYPNDIILGNKTSEYHNSYLDKEFLIREEERFYEMLKNSKSVQRSFTLERNGKELILDEWSVPYYINGKIAGMITGWTDMTEINFLNSQLIISRDEAIKANKDKSDFIAIMSHEIRTPLNAIIGSLEISFIDNEKKYTKQAYNASLDLIDIVNNVLDISKIEMGDNNLNLEYVEIKKSLTNISSLFVSLCDKKKLDLFFDLKIDDTIYVYTDIIYLRQILNNILSNAIKFTPSGSITVNGYIENDNVIVNIIDTGVGMNEKQINDLKIPFVTDSEKEDCYGFGSTIIYRLCSILNIKVNIESVVGIGTKVSLIIPKISKLESEILDKNNNSNFPEHENNHVNFYGKNIIVVDDYHINCSIIKRQLEIIKMNVTTCSNALDAWNLINQSSGNFDILITDCHMPEITGFELTKIIRSWEIKENKKSMLILGFTANSQSEIMDLCISAGMNDCLFKPATLRGLQEKIHFHLTLADNNIDIIKLRHASMEMGLSFEDVINLLYTALDDANNQFFDKDSINDTLSTLHKLKGITKIIGENDLLNLIDDFEKNNSPKIFKKISSRIINLKSCIKKLKN